MLTRHLTLGEFAFGFEGKPKCNGAMATFQSKQLRCSVKFFLEFEAASMLLLNMHALNPNLYTLTVQTMHLQGV